MEKDTLWLNQFLEGIEICTTINVSFFLPENVTKTIKIEKIWLMSNSIQQLTDRMIKELNLPFFIAQTKELNYKFNRKHYPGGIWPVTDVFKYNICLPIKYSLDWDFLWHKNNTQHGIVNKREHFFKSYCKLSDKGFLNYINATDYRKADILIKTINRHL